MGWFRKTVNQGSADGQVFVSFLYRNGENILQVYSRAMEWFLLAASQGDSDAQDEIGELYSNGHGVSQDRSQVEDVMRL
ncbi:hypothetical protein BGZ97_010051 [Linnemannia gamsii]|uniref:Sel1 repeat family protein n=1 Tax=Linnemannia gamsii TaxID=64522 RepID=A0A9P6RAE8_9FUNG|nr:hypothetical protein BGZ97_010051 [Linnemannia gamsii]